LARQKAINLSLRHGERRMLKFADFVASATATASLHVDAHWSLQDDILNIPGASRLMRRRQFPMPTPNNAQSFSFS
jgi:hypothetical protein